ncbi:TonB-dependent siderophore receptor [Flavobacterium restrictum]|uniref:TonB-dependent receptor n=1 Tax=Flavobacterium restrictum TaxID=2594428 RepID=A0A553E8P3_9FLAO|nr:TonB-dependent receptor [Flavobacterium restrictum]TRX41406.1 TonB-dependent receptor [Flavobacterium restrictum]
MKYILVPTLALLFSYNSQAQDMASLTKNNNYNEIQYAVTDSVKAVLDTVKNKKGEILQEVIVTSSQQKNPVTIGKAGIKPMDLPQSVAVVNQATIQNQQITTMTDLLKNTNGVYIMGTTGGYQEEIASRGYALGSSNTFKNGVRYFNGMPVEMSGVEKAEFLKGSAAILFGNVAAGGVMNIVTKKPKFDFGGEVGYRFGSFGVVNPKLDFYGPIGKSKKIAFRVNGTFEKANSFRKEVSSEKYYVNPSLLVKFNDKTQLLVEGDYLKSTATPDFGAGVINYELVAIPRDRFVGVTWGHYDAKQGSATATLTHQINSNWNLSFINALRYYQTDLFSTTRPNNGTLITADGTYTRNLQRSEIKDNYFIQQLDLKGNFKTGTIDHNLLVGVESERYKTLTTAYFGLTKANNNGQAYYDIINIFQPYNSALEKPAPELAKNTLTTAPINRVGFYVQDLISFNEYIKLLAGVRYSYQDTESTVYTYTTQKAVVTNNYDGAFSPRVGLVFQPTKMNSLFASYSNSFTVNTGTDINGNALDPSLIDQVELGSKNTLLKERLYANVTVYQITNSNLAQTSLENGNANTNIKELAGKTQSKGVELDFIYNPAKGLSILAGYSFNEIKYRESNTYIVGSQLLYNPKNTANLNVNYKFESGILNGFNFGLINSYVGTRYAGRSTRIQVQNDARKPVKLDEYIQMDATMGYVINHFGIRAKLSNLTNELSYNMHDDNSLNPIAPRNYSVALNYTF